PELHGAGHGHDGGDCAACRRSDAEGDAVQVDRPDRLLDWDRELENRLALEADTGLGGPAQPGLCVERLRGVAEDRRQKAVALREVEYQRDLGCAQYQRKFRIANWAFQLQSRGEISELEP